MMGNCNQKVILKLKLAQKNILTAIMIFQEDSCNLQALKYSQKAQKLIKEAANLVACNHLQKCVSDLMKKEEIDNTSIEVKRLFKYGFLSI